MRKRHIGFEWWRFACGVLLAVLGPVLATVATAKVGWLQGHGEFSVFVVAVAVTSAFGTGPALLSALLSITLLRLIVDTGTVQEAGRSELIAGVSLVFVAAAVSQLVGRARRSRRRFEEMNASLASNELLLRQLVDEATGSRESLEIALEAGRMVAWDSTPDGELSFSNGFAAIHGRPADGVTTLDVYRQMIHPADRARVAAELADAARDHGNDDFRLRFRIIRPDGSERWVEDRGRHERDERGRVLRSFGVAVDITEQVEADQRLKAAELRYRTLVERLPLTVYAGDPTSREALYFSPQIEELTGYTAEEMLARGGLEFWRSLILEEDRDESVSAFDGFMGNNTNDYYREYRIRHRDGQVKWVSSAAQFLAAEDGAPVSVQGFLLDITRRREALAELASAEERYRTLVEQLPLVTYITNVETAEMVYIAPQIEQMSGFTPAEINSMGGRRFWIERIHPDDLEVQRLYNDWIASGAQQSVRADRYRIQHKDGHWVWVTSAAQLVEGPTGDRLVQGFILDVSEQVAAEESFRTVFEASPFGIMVGEIDSGEGGSRKITQVNDEYCRIVGRSSAELIGTSAQDLMHPDERDINTPMLTELLTGERQSFQSEWRYVRPDGEEVLVRGTTSFIGWARETVARAVMMVEDVTAERRAQRERTDLEQRYRTLIEQLPLVTYMNMPDKTLGFMSPQLGAIIGYDIDEFVRAGDNKFTFTDLIHKDDWPRVSAAIDAANANKEPFHVEYRVQTKDGRWVWLRDEQVTITGTGGELLYSLGFLVDITHAKEVEQELAAALDDARNARELAERTLAELDVLIQTSPVALALIDRDGRFIRVSESLAQLNGLSADEHTGRHFREIVEPRSAELVADGFDRALAGEHVTVTDELRRNGKVSHLHVGYYPVIRPDGEVIGVSVAILDLTEQRELEQRIQQSHQLESLGRLAGGIAHDFNNILTSVQISADMILDQIEDGAIRAEAEAARTAAIHGAGLVKQLLAFGRQQVIQPQPVDLNATLEGLYGMLAKLASAEEIELAYELDPSAPWIIADTSQIGQVALNLTVNARDAMPDGGQLTISTQLADDRKSVELRVSDTGVGMNDEVQARLFEPFFTTKDEGTGTGLGLATVYGIVTQTGGEITVDSAEGVGSTFTICWPTAELDESQKAEIAEEPRQSAAAVPGAAKPVILLAEDEDGVRMLVSSLLTRRGFTVVEADDGLQALELAQEHPEVGLLLTDVRMPRMGGGELAERLRGMRPDLPVVFISGQSDDERVRDQLGGGRAAFLAKPFGADEIEQTILALVSRQDSSV